MENYEIFIVCCLIWCIIGFVCALWIVKNMIKEKITLANGIICWCAGVFGLTLLIFIIFDKDGLF